jgi:hypothetical protein
MSLADRTSSDSSIWRSVSTSPVWMGTVDWSLCSSLSYSVTSSAVTVMEGPAAPAGTGWSRRITKALVSLVKEAIGTDGSGPDCWA